VEIAKRGGQLNRVHRGSPHDKLMGKNENLHGIELEEKFLPGDR